MEVVWGKEGYFRSDFGSLTSRVPEGCSSLKSGPVERLD